MRSNTNLLRADQGTLFDEQRARQPESLFDDRLGRLAIASLAPLLALILAHKFLPAGRRSLRDIAPGILLTSAMWIAAGIAFGSFLDEFARNYVTTYAGLASVMIALMFLYMIASIFIFGGELNAAILRAKRKRDGNLKVERGLAQDWGCVDEPGKFWVYF